MLVSNSGGIESIAQPSNAVPTTTSTATGEIAFTAVFPTLGLSAVESLSSFNTPVRFAIASTPLNARITLTNAIQLDLENRCLEWFRCANVRCGRLRQIR